MARPSGIAPALDLSTPLNQLATRLGAVSTCDGRGTIVYHNSFQETWLDWQAGSIGAGATLAISPAQPKRGGTSLLCATGATLGWSLLLQKWMIRPSNARIGFEISFTWPAGAGIDYLYFSLNIFDGTNIQRGGVWFEKSSNRLYSDPNGTTWGNPLATIAAPIAGNGFYHTLKVAVDRSTGRYIRLIFNNQEFDLSNRVMPTAASATNPSVLIGFNMQKGTASANQDIYISDAILTESEP